VLLSLHIHSCLDPLIGGQLTTGTGYLDYFLDKNWFLHLLDLLNEYRLLDLFDYLYLLLDEDRDLFNYLAELDGWGLGFEMLVEQFACFGLYLGD
jgi:hypothetical protein